MAANLGNLTVTIDAERPRCAYRGGWDGDLLCDEVARFRIFVDNPERQDAILSCEVHVAPLTQGERVQEVHDLGIDEVKVDPDSVPICPACRANNHPHTAERNGACFYHECFCPTRVHFDVTAQPAADLQRGTLVVPDEYYEEVQFIPFNEHPGFPMPRIVKLSDWEREAAKETQKPNPEKTVADYTTDELEQIATERRRQDDIDERMRIMHEIGDRLDNLQSAFRGPEWTRAEGLAFLAQTSRIQRELSYLTENIILGTRRS